MVIKRLPLIGALMLITLIGLTNLSPAAQSSADKQKSQPSPRQKIYFDNPSFDFELQRALGYTVSGGADANEVLFTAHKITEGDEESWYKAWRETADRIYGIGEECLGRGHLVSAREAFLRASMYYRTADFYLRGNIKDPRILETWKLSRESFRKGAALLDYPPEIVSIPYEGITLPGYIFKPDDSMAPRKTLIVQTGFDGTGEELYFETAFFALKRGYNVLIFEGPGQGGVLREQHLYFRPDWEKVVSPVVDFALQRQDVDPKRLALLGISMGGYMAPRAAAYEHRLGAVIANTGVYDMGAQPGQTMEEAQKSREQIMADPEATNAWAYNRMKTDVGFRWSVNNGMFTFGKKTPAEFFLATYDYNLIKTAPLIKIPALVVDAEDDQFFPGQAKQLFEAISGPKTYMMFTRQDMASAHCQMGAMDIANQRILDWLDELFK